MSDERPSQCPYCEGIFFGDKYLRHINMWHVGTALWGRYNPEAYAKMLERRKAKLTNTKPE